MKNNKGDDLSQYLVTGMIIGLFVGSAFSIIMRNNTLLAINGTGFGLSFGLLIAVIVYGLKKSGSE
ncbi:hypothetical protein [Alkaliphilus transvaalensis]|uniref:hypothetical protein n=1 Tax=Alkaliphilus transvaalensis TaxID=114628 RepID=UPI00047A0002|nr:hypothetical protein [Alkaliphilus transvaalensis]